MNKETKSFIESLLEKYNNPVDLESCISGGEYINGVWYCTEDLVSMFMEITHAVNTAEEEDNG